MGSKDKPECEKSGEICGLALFPFRFADQCGPWLLVLAVVCLGNVSVASADVLSSAIDTSIANNRQEAKVQHRIEQLDDETQAMLEEYQRLSRELDVSKVYHDQLERLVAAQATEKVVIQQQMADLELTQREIVPLMLRMVDALAESLTVDLPFLMQERQQRLDQLRALMDRADVSVGEKYRRVLDAYRIEMEYGRTIEAYRGELGEGKEQRTVDMLRVGRVGLYYQTLDRQEVGHWNADDRTWEMLPADYRLPIRNGLRIARNQAAPDLLRLPVHAPVSAQAAKTVQP